MNPSLSVVLPVHNAEQHLTSWMLKVLDELAELETTFEASLIDDASTDQTVEVADELGAAYPQLRVVHLGERHRLLRACLIGIRHTSGPIVLLADIQRGVSPSELQSLWSMRDEPDLVAAHSEENQPSSGRFIHELLDIARGIVLPDTWRELPGTQLIRRQAFRDLSRFATRSTSVRRITRTDLAEADTHGHVERQRRWTTSQPRGRRTD